MTGALCIIGTRSTVQPLVATLFQLAYLLTVLKLSPYASDLDDTSSFVSSLSLCLTTLAAIMLKAGADAEDASARVDAEHIGTFIVVVAVLTAVSQLVTTFLSTELGSRWCRRQKQPGGEQGCSNSGPSAASALTAVADVDEPIKAHAGNSKPDAIPLPPATPSEETRVVTMTYTPGTSLGMALAKGVGGAGVQVSAVAPAGAAKNAGVQVGDVLAGANGQVVLSWRLSRVKAYIKGLPAACTLTLHRKMKRSELDLLFRPTESAHGKTKVVPTPAGGGSDDLEMLDF